MMGIGIAGATRYCGGGYLVVVVGGKALTLGRTERHMEVT